MIYAICNQCKKEVEIFDLIDSEQICVECNMENHISDMENQADMGCR